MGRRLIATLCIVFCLPAYAGDSGRIAFKGSIVERTCPFADERPNCPAGHAAAADVRVLDGATARRTMDAALLDYALDRSPPMQPLGWRVVEVSFR